MAGIKYNVNNPFVYISENTVTETLTLNPTISLVVQSTNTKFYNNDFTIFSKNVNIASDITTNKVGFFGVTAKAQQARPTDVATIVALLRAYGLCN